MIDDKLKITKLLISELKLPDDENSVKKYHNIWWKNIRNSSTSRMRLTQAGFLALKDKLNLKTYQIDIKKINFTNQILLNLDKFIDSPYYLDNDSVTVFREKTAIELILYEGNLEKFIAAKLACEKRIKDLEKNFI